MVVSLAFKTGQDSLNTWIRVRITLDELAQICLKFAFFQLS
jgi:hypothetical protein